MTSLTSDTAAPLDDAVRRPLSVTYVVFAAAGFLMSSWASRIPQIRDELHLAPSALGFVLLAIACGSLVSLPLSGPLVAQRGSRQIVATTAVLFGTGMSLVAVGYRIGVAPVVVGLFMMGFAAGAWDVAMNVHGAIVEQLLGRSVMSRFHAAFSLGTVTGALIGAAMVIADVSVTIHLIVVAVFVTSVVVRCTRHFRPHQGASGTRTVEGTLDRADGSDSSGSRGNFAAWREPRTLLIGLFVLAFAFAEGVANDWIAVATIDGHHAEKAIGTLVFAAFLTAMTVGRWFGPAVLDRHGRTPVVRVLAVLGIAGTLLFVFAPFTWLAAVGALLWGLGASLGFPVGMSAGADEPVHAAGRVSVISSIGYCAFLVGPPLIGFIGDHQGVLHALLAVAALLVMAALLAPVVSPPAAADAAPAGPSSNENASSEAS
jgi:MFS family permease